MLFVQRYYYTNPYIRLIETIIPEFSYAESRRRRCVI